MAADADSYEDNPAELHPWYYTQREPIASTLYDYRWNFFPVAGSSAASRLRVELFARITPPPSTTNMGQLSNKQCNSHCKRLPPIRYLIKLQSWLTAGLFFCGWIFVCGHPTLSCVGSINPLTSTTNVGQMNDKQFSFQRKWLPTDRYYPNIQLLTAGLFLLLLELCRRSSYAWCVNSDENLRERGACWEGIRQSGRYLRR